MIPEEKVIDFVEKNREIIDRVKPSFFEMTVAMAFDHFDSEETDVAVIETGLGGRLDSTNIITPVLSVITNIGHDHMNLLGNSLEKIAFEKAGIIKPSVPVVISETREETYNVFVAKAAETGSSIAFADSEYRCILHDSNRDGERGFDITGTGDKNLHGVTVLGGDYQSKNIQAVLLSVRLLEKEFNISQNNILEGIRNVIKNTGLAGRWQIMGHDPLVICDTGHNREGLEYVISQLKSTPKKNLHIVMGFVNDKDLSMVLPLFPVNAFYYFTKASVPRALDENTLMLEASKYGLKGSAYPDVRTALFTARSKADPADLIFVGGSTFVVADAL
jgi:dihydrofolate synthase/folylpolyglutamate synthase